MRTYLRLLSWAAPYRWRFLGALACMAVLAGATAMYVNLLGPVLEFLFTGSVGALGSLGRLLPSEGPVAAWFQGIDRTRALRVLPAVVIAVALLKGVAYFGQAYLMGTTSQRIIVDLRGALFDHLLRLSPSFYARRHTGDLLSRVTNDVQAVEAAVSTAVASYLRDGLTVGAVK